MLDILSLWLLPGLFGAGFIISLISSNNVWLTAKVVTISSLFLVLAVTINSTIHFWLSGELQDGLGIIMTWLICILGWIIVGFSKRYLDGEHQQANYVRAILFTLASVTVLVISQNVALIALAWSATSFGLHHLLTFYSERKAAQVVAHKKFIVNRLADLCLVIAVMLIYFSVESFQLSMLTEHIVMNALSIELYVAALLFVLAAILKTAQLPLHGWLIQVMEAPTPVSAMLHAGVVNMGGFVLIRLADLIGAVPIAQWLLIIVGGLTALLAGIVMMTRVSIKVRLAWSTCSQMGFMLMEIGLGLYELALLHLVAHSLYKAHAFLSSGETVQDAYHSRVQGKASPVTWMLFSAPFVSAFVVWGSLWAWDWVLNGFDVSLLITVIITIGLAPLLWEAKSMRSWFLGLWRSLMLSQIYFFCHWLFSQVVVPQPIESYAATVWVAGLFLVMYLAQVGITLFREKQFVQGLYTWAYHGFFLDEKFTRLSFKYWPVRFSKAQAQTSVNKINTSVEDAA